MAPASEEEAPLQAHAPVSAMQGQETLQSPQEAGNISLDMHRYYSKHQLPSLSHYGNEHSAPCIGSEIQGRIRLYSAFRRACKCDWHVHAILALTLCICCTFCLPSQPFLCRRVEIVLQACAAHLSVRAVPLHSAQRLSLPADKSLRSQWDVEQSLPHSARIESIPAHRWTTSASGSPTAQRMDRSRHASPHEVSLQWQSRGRV